MIEAWLVVREEKHIDNAYWTCLDKDDAFKIASDVAAFWLERYEPAEGEEVDRNLYGNQVYHVRLEDAFSVEVVPHAIRQVGEWGTGDEYGGV